MRSALPQAGLVPPKWQVLTPRTMISKPVLGLERIASPVFLYPQFPASFKKKLFTAIHRCSLQM